GERQHADGKVDEEDPAPRVVEGNPSAERRSERRREHRRDAIEREREAALFRRKRVCQDRLRHRLEAPSSHALQDAKYQQQREARRETTEQRAQREDRETSGEEALSAERDREPPADWQHDGVGDEVRREDPR